MRRPVVFWIISEININHHLFQPMTTCWLSKTLLFLLLSLFLSSIVFYYLLVSKLSFHSSISSKDVVETTSNPINATPEVIENLFYAHNPHDFIHRVSDCMMDRNCLILYWHTQKTGRIFYESGLYVSEQWCGCKVTHPFISSYVWH